MKQAQLIKKILPGFIPLIVYIIADELWGMKVGLAVAVVTGAGEMIFTWIREKRFDRFVLVDIALLAILSGVSVLLENDLFFKLKPALLEFVLAVILGLSAFSPLDPVGLMTKRYFKEISLNGAQELVFRQNIRILFFLISGHIVLILYSAFFLSKEAWLFISGGLLYVLLGIYFVTTIIRSKKKAVVFENGLKGEEWLPLVNEAGEILGKAPRSVCHNGERLLHPVIHLHVLNNNGHIYLQKRPMSKLVQPGKWDTSVGGHISFGESLETALNREAYEEIGLKNFSARLIGKYRWDSEIESELVYYFITYDFKNINIHSDEVEEGKFWSHSQIEKNIGAGIFTPNFEYEYSLLKSRNIR